MELSSGQVTCYSLVLSHTNIHLRSERFIPERLVKEATKAIDPIGHASDSDGDGLDQVASEMTQLDLHGTSSMGPVQVSLDPAHRSLGEIEEQVNNTAGILDVPPFASTDRFPARSPYRRNWVI